MEFQTNPYLIWQLIPVFTTLWLGIYIQTRPRKKPESRGLALLMYSGSFWSLTSAIQMLSPQAAWQNFWHHSAFIAIVLVPVAWFLLAVKFTGYWREKVDRLQAGLLVIPAISLFTALSNDYHHLFFSSASMAEFNEVKVLELIPGPLFIVHSLYSYLLIVLGFLLLGISLVKNFMTYGAQAYVLIIGVMTPLIGNVLYVLHAFPPGFPDPTPIAFTITVLAFSWAIFAGRMLDMVPIAHEAIITNLTSGILVLDMEHKVVDINQAARQILGVRQGIIFEQSIQQVLAHDPELCQVLLDSVDAIPESTSRAQMVPPGKKDIYEVQVTAIQDKHAHRNGTLFQFTDISLRRQAEQNLIDSQENFDAILDSLKDYYFETDIQGIVTYINKAFYEHLGYMDRTDLLGKNFRHFTDRKSVREVYSNFNKVFASAQAIDLFRYVYHTRDGKEHIGETTVSPIIKDGKVTGARGVLRNITDKVLTDAQLRQAKEEVEVRVEELSALNRIAGISSKSLMLEEINRNLCIELTQIFPVCSATIALLTPAKDQLEMAAFHSKDPGETGNPADEIFFNNSQVMEKVIGGKTSIVINEQQGHEAGDSHDGAVQDEKPYPTLVVPLLTHAEAIGVIKLPAEDGKHSFDASEIRLAETIAVQVATAIDNARMYAWSETARDIAERDLEIGRQIQAGFFPEFIPHIPGWEMAAHFEGARHVSGDFYDFFQLENSKLTVIALADVCDKGVGAALFMVLIRSLLRAFCNDISTASADLLGALNGVITNTNKYITRTHASSAMFATLFLGLLDPEENTLYYVNGGHLPPAILDKEGHLIQRLESSGPAIGIIPEANYQVKKIYLDKGDFLVGYTDGATDATNQNLELFGEERLLKYIQTPWTSLFSMVSELKFELGKFKGEQPQFDDITLISIRRKLKDELEQHAICRQANMEALADIEEFIKGSAAHCEISNGQSADCIEAARIACHNILSKGFPDRQDGVISAFFEKEHDQVRLIIRDDGRHLTSGESDETDELGMHLLAEIMEQVSYKKMAEKGNELTLVRRLAPASMEIMEVEIY